MPVTISIQYCGGWGYGRYCNALSSYLQDKFGDDIEIEAIRDPGTTGNFEVKNVATGELLHSKKAGGDRCESEESKSALAEKISALME